MGEKRPVSHAEFQEMSNSTVEKPDKHTFLRVIKVNTNSGKACLLIVCTLVGCDENGTLPCGFPPKNP